MGNRVIYSIVIGLMMHTGLNAQLYTEMAKDVGIDHYMLDPNSMGGGVAIFDFNNDGFDDIYLTGGLKNDQLFENLGNGTFKDVTKEMRITQFGLVKTMGVVTGDINNDGYTDLFITTTENDHCYLLKNESGKFFTDISKSAGIDHKSWSMTATMADYDLDGDLDIYVGNYVDFNALPFDQNILNPLPDFFYENNGKGIFAKIDNPLSLDAEGCTLATSFSDIDQDGDSDLFVLNDFGDFYVPNKLLLNNFPSNNYSNISNSSEVNSAINSMGIAVGDFNEDGNFDYYVTNIGHNILYQNNGSIQFTNTAQDLKVSDGTGICWGTAFLDVNNDGHLDLYASKGSLLNLNDTQNNLLYLGSGSQEQFQDVSEMLRTNQPNKARGMAYGDLNDDGYLDMIAVNIRLGPGNLGKTKVYMNSGVDNGNWIKIALEGTSNNRSAYGAIVKVYLNGKPQIREVSGGSSYLSIHSKDVHFGLGTSMNVDSLIVQWPRGKKKEVFTNLPVNTTYYIREDDRIYERILETAYVCEGESVTINNEVQTQEGVYRDLVEGEMGSLGTLKITKLVIKEKSLLDCNSNNVPIEGEIGNRQMIVYPSPFEDTINVIHNVPLSDSVQVMLIDVSGTIVRSNRINVKNTSGSIKISGYQTLPPGVYILTVVSDGQTYSRKLLK